jgi:NADH-quinone oxidoreductase subunit F
VDLHVIGPSPTAAERAAVDAVLGAPASGWDGGVRDPGVDGRIARGGFHAAMERRDLLLPALHALMARVGWISEGGLAYVCRRLTVPPAEAYGVATFYALFSVEKRPPAVLHVCDDVACRMAGADDLCASLEQSAGAAVLRSPCLGLCERAPAAMATIAGESPRTLAAAPVDAAAALALLAGRAPAEPPIERIVPQAGDASLRLLARVGRVAPTDLAAYERAGGGAGLRRAIALGADQTIAEVIASRLVGRGGAAFPAGKKWEAVRAQPARPKYLVCNADESEPGTFKDRVLLEHDPFAVLEGMIIAAFAAGCERGYLYLRGEYPLAAERVEHALAALRTAGWLGRNVLGSGHAFDIELRRGAGAYICGEETALFNSLEGKRGEPRAKPPFPVVAGLFHKPTVVNNVETLACVPLVLAGGGAAFAQVGSGQSTGPKLFCVSGRVARPGVYEVPFGATLRQLLALAGGVAGGRPLQAILLGGAAGSFVGPEALDTPLTLEGARAAGATLGSGVILVLDDQADLLDLMTRIAAFFRDESCGQCVPCRVGTVRQEESLARLRALPAARRAGELALLADLGQVMRDASICGLGQTATAAVESGLRLLARTEPSR